jgi:hypothetical protein
MLAQSRRCAQGLGAPAGAAPSSARHSRPTARLPAPSAAAVDVVARQAEFSLSSPAEMAREIRAKLAKEHLSGGLLYLESGKQVGVLMHGASCSQWADGGAHTSMRARCMWLVMHGPGGGESQDGEGATTHSPRGSSSMGAGREPLLPCLTPCRSFATARTSSTPTAPTPTSSTPQGSTSQTLECCSARRQATSHSSPPSSPRKQATGWAACPL